MTTSPGHPPVASGMNTRMCSVSRRLTPDEVAYLVAAYTAPNDDGTWTGTTTIARTLGVSVATVRRLLIREGVTPRGPREAHAHGKRCKPITNVPVGDQPTCKCGCEQPVEWDKFRKRWRAYVGDHYRDPPGWVRPERVRYRAGFIGPRE